MDDPRWEPGMPVLDRQGIAGGQAPDRIPETNPTPLGRHYINLSAVALVVGAIGITALETGSTMTSPLVKICTIVAAPLLVLTTADAALRFWRSAQAWWPLDRGRALFRMAWVAVALLGLGIVVGAASVVLAA